MKSNDGNGSLTTLPARLPDPGARDGVAEFTLADWLQDRLLSHKLNDLAKIAHETAVVKLWWNQPREFGTAIALIHSELSEALEAARARNVNGPGGVAEELADVIIRTLDLAGHMGIEIGSVVVGKMAYNLTREARHGKDF